MAHRLFENCWIRRDARDTIVPGELAQLARGEHAACNGVEPDALAVAPQGFSREVLLRFDLFDLGQAAAVALLFAELRTDEGADDLDGELRTRDALAQTQHIPVVVLNALVSGVRIAGKEGARTRHFARCNATAGPRATDDDGAIHLVSDDRLSGRAGIVGVINWGRRRVGPEVNYRYVRLGAQAREKHLFQLETGVI